MAAAHPSLRHVVVVVVVFDDNDVDNAPLISNSSGPSIVGVVGFESIGGDPTSELVSDVSVTVSAKSPS